MTETFKFIPFFPSSSRTAARNRDEFVRFCREELLKVFGPNIDFDEASWDVSDYFRHRGQTARTLMNFTYRGKPNTLGSPLPEPLAAFSKAYITYICAKQRRMAAPTKVIDAFRILALALNDKGLATDIGLVDAEVLHHAAHLADTYWGRTNAHHVILKLAVIATFLRAKNLSDRIHQPWSHGRRGHRKRPRADGVVNQSSSKVPSKEVLDALAHAYHIATATRDVILTSIMALLACAPQRINEVFALTENCEVEETIDGKKSFGLRWAGSKGYPDHVKPVVGVLIDVAKGAIGKLRKHTVEARRIAAWYEQHPTQLYLPDDCIHFRGQDLTLNDIAEITGLRDLKGAHAFVQRKQIRPIGTKPDSGKRGSGRRANLYRFSDVERAVVSLLPDGFPILDPRTGLRYSQAMMVVRLNEFGHDSSWRCMIAPVTYGNVKNGCCHTTDGRKNVFDRLGLSTEERPISLSTHKLRHFLNNLANHADVSQLDIAAWSGRTNVSQNSHYDHETSESIIQRRRDMERQLAKVRAARGQESHPLTVTPADPISRQDALAGSRQSHVTEFGYCEHDFALSPCPILMEHLHCIEHVCIKGVTEFDKVELAVVCARRSLASARDALPMEIYGAEEWVKAQSETLARLEQLHSILVDPRIPNGSRIRLARSGHYTLLEQAMHDHDAMTQAEQVPKPQSRKVLLQSQGGVTNAQDQVYTPQKIAEP